MTKHATEVPVTYLNKGQSYSLRVVDTRPPIPSCSLVSYRTFVRVSFEEEEQRLKPATAWQFWKECRGLCEAQQRGSKPLAVEFLGPLTDNNKRKDKHCQVQLEHQSFDGFCVIWATNLATDSPSCDVLVRFNFLSTDFTRAKGVKGVPVRLCAKTEVLSQGEERTVVERRSELCHCKIKLFRDHGAQRKLANDVERIKKKIEKLEQQVSQAELSGIFRKRKWGNTSASVRESGDRNTKIARHERMPSVKSRNWFPDKSPVQDDPHTELAMMRNTLSPGHPVTVFYLRGDEQDDPDIHPVQLPVCKNVSVETESPPDMDDIYVSKRTSTDAIHLPTECKPPSGLSHMLLFQAHPNTVLKIAIIGSEVFTESAEPLGVEPYSHSEEGLPNSGECHLEWLSVIS